MAKQPRPWSAGAAAPFEKLTPNLWRTEQAMPALGLHRVMAVAKNAAGGLVIHNAICLPEPMMAELAAFGDVQTIIVPSGYHRLDGFAWKQRFPAAALLCPAGARKRVTQLFAVDGTYDDFANDDVLQLHHFAGVAKQEGYLLVADGASQSLVVNDIIFNMPHQSGLLGFMLKHLTQSSGGPHTSRVGKWLLVKDKRALAADLRRLAALPGLARVLVAHHQTIDHDVAATLARVADSL